MKNFIEKILRWIRCFFSILIFRLKSYLIILEAFLSSEPPDDSPFLRLGWELDAGTVELPDWFEENRVQGHTRLPIHHRTRGLDSPAFQNAAARFRELGAGAYTRHVKTCSRIPTDAKSQRKS